MKLWHKISIGVAAGLLCLAAVPFLIPLGAYRGQIETMASRAAGREVTIEGPLSLTFHPEFGVSARNVTVANIGGGRAPHLLTLDALVVGAKFWPLLKGRLEVTRIALEKPLLRLERNAAGAGNWESTGNDDGEGGFAVLRRLGISDISIRDGGISYTTPEGAPFLATRIELALLLPPQRALTVAGEMTWRGEEFSLEGEIADPDALFADGASAAHLGMGSDIGGGRFAGRVNLKGRSDGTLRLSTSSLRDAATWAGVNVPPADRFGRGQDPYGAFDFEGGVMADAQKLMLTGIRMRLERVDVQGVLSLDRSGEVPMLTGEVGLRRVNLDSYFTRSEPTDEDAAEDAGPARLNLDLLKQLNAKLKLHLRSVVAGKLLIDQAVMDLTGQDGVLRADLSDLEIYDGIGTASIEIDARGAVPIFKERLTLERVRMYPLLVDLVDVDRVDGDGALTLELTARGDTEEAILSSLAGIGKFRVVGGNIRGANLIGIARLVKGLVSAETLAGVLGETRATDFSELAASFTIRDGVARTNDVSLVHTAFRLTGRGSVDFANRTLDLSLDPRAPANARLSLPDLGIPFRVSGPWDDLSYRPDLARLPAGAVRSLITDPVGALESLFGR